MKYKACQFQMTRRLNLCVWMWWNHKRKSLTCWRIGRLRKIGKGETNTINEPSPAIQSRSKGKSTQICERIQCMRHGRLSRTTQFEQYGVTSGEHVCKSAHVRKCNDWWYYKSDVASLRNGTSRKDRCGIVCQSAEQLVPGR